MALTPQNNDAFFREVDDELRRDQLTSFGMRYGRIVLIAAALALAALGGFLYWQHHRAQQAGLDSEALSGALADLGQGKAGPAKAKLDQLAQSPRDVYRASARLTAAAAAAERNDIKAAVAQFAAVAADGDVPAPFRDLALIRQTALEFDTLPPAQVIARLTPLAVAGNPWFGSAGEMVAVSHLKLNQPKLAAPIFAAIARDETAPETLRSRSARIAAVLGIDTVVQRPAAGKE
ncbi:MAG: hypothetical protein JWL91_1014 [Sphingomonas bacterium]|nr:tetratricopeptide repeat protein [Sphingomonas bacterium]MDB5689138.1 hypothetical protein [Sphingomonas bacterium]